MSRIPGFQAYYLLDAGDGIVASISICESKEGATAAGVLAAGWFRSDWPSFQLIPPEVTDGEVLVHAEVARASGRRLSERRSGADQRVTPERRVAGERRVVSLPPEVDRRSGVDRRVASERRTDSDRRLPWQPLESVRASRRLGVAPPWRRSSRIS